MKIDLEKFIDIKKQVDRGSLPEDRERVLDLLAELSSMADSLEPVFSADYEDAAAVWGYISDSLFMAGSTAGAADASTRQLNCLIEAHGMCAADKKGAILDRISDALYNIIEYRNMIKIDKDLAAGAKFADDTCDDVMNAVRDILPDAPNVYIHATNRAKNAERRRPEEHY